MANLLRKAALARWDRIIRQETSKIPNDKNAHLKKSALCGFIAGDGNLQIRRAKGENCMRYELNFFADDKKMLSTYMHFIKELYHKTPSVRIRDNMYVARLSQKFVALDLLKHSKFGIYTWSFPSKLFKIKGAKENWLRAFFSAEGYVNRKTVKIQSVNVKSIKLVSKMLNEMGIYHSYYVYTPKNKKHSRVGMIFIGSLSSRRIYYEKIGFWHSRKEKLLEEALNKR